MNSDDAQDSKMTRSRFRPQEDELLRLLVSQSETRCWTKIASQLPGRNVRQCRDRWNHYLSRTPHAGQWTPEEDALLRTKAVGRPWEWQQMADFFPNRSERDVQMRWALIKRGPKKGEEDPGGTDTQSTAVAPAPETPAPAPSAPSESPDLGDSLWWSFWDGPYSFSFT
jgi:hypothetical protein